MRRHGVGRVRDPGRGLSARRTSGAGARPGDRVLDVCARARRQDPAVCRRGGADGLVVACDVRPGACAAGRYLRRGQACAPRSCASTRPARCPFSGPSMWSPWTRRVRGLGTLRRDPDIKWRRSAAASLGTRTGSSNFCVARRTAFATPGPLVYTTCSSEPEENEDVIARFLADAPRVQATGRHRRLDAAFLTAGGSYR